VNGSRAPLTTTLLVAAFAALVVIVVTTFWLGQRAQRYAIDVTSVREIRLSASELRSSLLTAETSQRGFLFSGNEIYLAPFDAAKASARREAARLQSAVGSYPQFLPMVAELDAVVEQKIAELEQAIAFKRAGQDEEALDLFLSNRGKALMDRMSVFVNGVVEASDRLLVEGVTEQVRNANWLRWTAVAGGLLIVLVVSSAVAVFRRTEREISSARDEVIALNQTLETRVADRTSALKEALARSELLLAEVNHRVANSLAMVASLVRLQVRSSKDGAVKMALSETEARISAIAAVHKRLYGTGDVGLVALDEYLSGLLENIAATMRTEGSGNSLTWELDEVKLKTDASINVGVVVTELVTNAFKYAYPDSSGEIRVRLRQVPVSRIEIDVEDDGVGKGSGTAKGTGLGTRIVSTMAASLGSEVLYADRKPGTTARLTLPL
jgi:two-component sensor histidine kinase